MQKTLHHLIIQLLVAAIVSLGIAQAGIDLCPPDCSHCGVAAVVSPCCDNMVADEVAAPVPVKAGHRPDCDHGSYCDASDAKNAVIPVHRAVDTDFASIAPALVVVVPELSVRYHSISLKSPPQGRQPALYTLHCSLII
ncbi:hypothetical protein [Desulfopila aestuarii]|uniref:hypothetical protein n=1 Tax=Desulfopila aestuarii TaxID=231440 RepID=UPI001160EF5F|nr:hypothetical protein [Desulfopila aestuarii]